MENTDPSTLAYNSPTELVIVRPRTPSVENVAAKTRREVIALDGQMFESLDSVESPSLQGIDSSHQSKQSEDTYTVDSSMTVANGQHGASYPHSETSSHPRDYEQDPVTETATSNNHKSENLTRPETDDLLQKTTLSSSSSTSSSSSSSPSSPSPSTSSSPGKLSPPESPVRDIPGSSQLLDQVIRNNTATLQSDLAPPSLARSLSMGKRQSMFLGDHITISQDGPIIESPSLQSPDSNDDQDMKEVQIETTDPSHLFWVPFHLHPEIAPNEYNKWLSKHGVDSQDSDGIIPSRKTSVSRRKSVLSAQYNPEEDQEEQPSKPTTISEENDNNDFLSGVFSASLELVGQPPMKTRTSIRRSVSLSVSSPTKESFPMDADEESIMAVKRPGGLERGGLSLLRRSARTKIRRNSTASNDIRPDASRLRQTLNANGEYAPVSLVDPGPQPLPSSSQHSGSVSAALVDNAGARKDGDSQPSKRFVSTLRDPSKPTITTYVEPHLLEQQRKENEEEAKREGESSPSFRVSAPGKLEHSAAARLLTETIENDRKERPDNFTVSYPIPPPVKLTQNLLQQQPSSPQSPTPKPLSPSTPSTPSTQLTQPPSKQKNSGQANANGTSTHAKKPSTWSWLWGKEKGSEKAAEPLSTGSNVSSLPSAQTASTEINTQTPPSNEVTVKKQSTLSMLFSRNGKSSSKAHATTAESTQSVTTNSGQLTSSDKPKYSNYNRLPIHIERAIYRLSHVKLANPRRPLQEQVLISNMMFWYLGVIQQQQMLQQQQAEQQQQQQLAQYQKEHSKGSDSKEEGKDSKSKIKPKKRKSQKKKNQQRGSSKSAERIVKSPEYEKQQQYHNNAGVTHVARPRQQGPIQAPENQRRARGNTDQDGQDFSDTYEESGGEDSDSAHQLAKQQIGSQSDTLTTLSIGSPPRSAQEDEEDDDVPLAHYQNMPRQSVPVS